MKYDDDILLTLQNIPQYILKNILLSYIFYHYELIILEELSKIISSKKKY